MPTELDNVLERCNQVSMPVHTHRLLCENGSLTFYELRRFLTVMYKLSHDKTTKTVLGDLLQVLAVMEVKRQSVPTIKKLKSKSPNIFDGF